MCKATVVNLRPGLIPNSGASAEANAPYSHAELSLPPSLRKLEEARQADMHSGAATFKKLFARAQVLHKCIPRA